MFWGLLIISVLLIWAIAAFFLEGEDHSQYDGDRAQHFDSHAEDEIATQQFLSQVAGVRDEVKKSRSIKKGFALVRQFADNLSADLKPSCQFITVKNEQIDAEWAVAAGADQSRRILFIHGGAFIMGSAEGHRKFADKLSQLVKAPVLSLNYRLMPENTRMQGIEDAQQAYRWILDNAPEAASPCEKLIVAGDSAGGNISLMLSSWSAQAKLQRPTAVIAFSPSTDTTLAAPTHRANRKTDPILGEGLGLLARLPRAIGLWLGLISMRMKPTNPLASPLFYPLDDLPPTLIHASSSEMLLGDSVRYTNKAVAAGSPVKLQVWKGQIHDWHLFNMNSGSANSAWQQVDEFIHDVIDDRDEERAA